MIEQAGAGDRRSPLRMLCALAWLALWKMLWLCALYRGSGFWEMNRL
jgi:hypothetical protein